MKPVEYLDFKSFCKGDNLVLNEAELKKQERKKNITKLTFKIGVTTAITLTAAPFSPIAVYAATAGVSSVVSPGNSWENLIDKLLDLLDPIAKIFGMIAGVAIMTGNGKIGLERLFWLSIGYITTRKVDDWIAFLDTI